MTAVSFTGGKDCVLAMHLYGSGKHLSASVEALRSFKVTWAPEDTSAAQSAISLLVTFAPPDVQFKAHPLAVIKAQARAMGISQMVCEINPGNPADSYRQHIQQLHQQHGITRLVTGDILDVANGFMQKAVEGTGVELMTPLWQQPRRVVLQAILDIGIQAVISCVNLSKYSQQKTETSQPGQQPANGCISSKDLTSVEQQEHFQSHGEPLSNSQGHSALGVLGSLGEGVFDARTLLLGHAITPELVEGALSTAHQLFGCDMCGEYGEYHTLVTAAPMFKQTLRLKPVDVVHCQSDRVLYAYMAWEVADGCDGDGAIMGV